MEKLKGINNKEQENGHAENEKMWSEDPIFDSDSEKEDSEPLCKIEEDPNHNFPTFSFSEKMKKNYIKHGIGQS